MCTTAAPTLRTGARPPMANALPATLTGVGARNHLSHATVNLDTHIRGVVALLETEGIQDAVLCGHSQGAWSSPGSRTACPSVSRRSSTWPGIKVRVTSRKVGAALARCL